MNTNRELLRKRPGRAGGNVALSRNQQFWAPELDDKYGSPHTPDDEEDVNLSVDADDKSPTMDRKRAYETIGSIVDREFADAVLRASKRYGSKVAGNKELISAIDTLIGDGFVFGEEDMDRTRHSYRERMDARRNGYPDDGIGSWYPKTKLPESRESPLNGMSVSQMRFLKEGWGRDDSVYVVSFAGGALDPHPISIEVEADSEQSALEKAVAKLEHEYDGRCLIDPMEVENNRDDYDEDNALYVDATMEGASQPWYVDPQTVRIEEGPPRGYDNDGYDSMDDNPLPEDYD